MNKIKDFFYNKNDIIIVLIIVICAGFLIYNRIGVIMDYPAKLADSLNQTETTEEVDAADESTDGESTDEESTDSEDENNSESSDDEN